MSPLERNPAPAQRFTFSFSPTPPRKHVRCDVCGWQATGNDVFAQADAHICDQEESRA